MSLNCAMNTNSAIFSYWYFSYPMPLAQGGSRSV